MWILTWFSSLNSFNLMGRLYLFRWSQKRKLAWWTKDGSLCKLWSYSSTWTEEQQKQSLWNPKECGSAPVQTFSNSASSKCLRRSVHTLEFETWPRRQLCSCSIIHSLPSPLKITLEKYFLNLVFSSTAYLDQNILRIPSDFYSFS